MIMRKTYSKKEIKQFLSSHSYAEELMDKKSSVIEENNSLFVDKKPFFRKYEDSWIPSLELLQEKLNILPKVIVDKGTPPFIAKGADLMRPGIVSCEEFEKDSLVVIIDEVHNFPIATGKSLFSSNEIMTSKEGKMIKIIFNLQSKF